MTVAELLADKFSQECKDGLYVTFHEGERIYGCDKIDDFVADTFGGRDISSYAYYVSDYDEPDELAIELK